MIHFVYVWSVIVFLVMVPKYVIDVAIIWLNDNIYSRNTWFPTTDVQTQNIGKPRYANRRAPTECRHTVATQATEYQRWRDVSCRSRRCRPMPTLGQRRNASWAINNIPALVQIMAWRRPGDKPLSEPMLLCSLTHICVTRPQWVNSLWPSDMICQHKIS